MKVLASVASVVLSCSACTSNPEVVTARDAGESDSSDAYCVETRTALRVNDISAFGFAASALLPLATGAHTATLGWITKSTDPPIASTALTVEVDTSAVEVEYVTRELKPGLHPKENPCPNTLELGAAMDFSTADGTFAEHWQTVSLVYQKPEGGNPAPDWLHAAVTLEPKDIHGTFAPSFDAGWCFYDVTVHIDFRPNQFAGTIQPSFISPPCDVTASGGAIASGSPSGAWPQP